MSTYYQIDNLDRRESIVLDGVFSSGDLSGRSLHMAILKTFLGFPWPRCSLRLGAWIGYWSGERIRISNDSEDPEDGGSPDWPDVGLRFLSDLLAKGLLDGFLLASDITLAPWHMEELKKGSPPCK